MKLKTVFFGVAAFSFFWVFIPMVLIYLNDYFSFAVFRYGEISYLGVLLLFFDAVIFVYCNNLFLKFGKGTFMPTEATKRFVERGLYRFVRNPIYVGHVFGILGIFLLFGRLSLLIYSGLVFFFIHLMVIFLEEPDLKRRFGKSYILYTKKVRRWGLF